MVTAYASTNYCEVNFFSNDCVIFSDLFEQITTNVDVTLVFLCRLCCCVIHHYSNSIYKAIIQNTLLHRFGMPMNDFFSVSRLNYVFISDTDSLSLTMWS